MAASIDLGADFSEDTFGRVGDALVRTVSDFLQVLP